jgi:hypothetical protein
MNHIAYRIILILVIPVIISLTACVGAEPIGVPTNTPTQTETALPTPSVTASATSPPTATVTPSPPPPTRTEVKLATLPPVDEINLGAAIIVPEAGFSFKPPSGFQIRQISGQVTMSSADGRLVISLSGIPILKVQDLEPIMQRFLDLVSQTFDEFHLGVCSPYRIGATNGFSCNLQAKLENEPVSGMAIIAAPEEDQLFYALAFAVETIQGDEWDQRAGPITEKILDNITFFKPVNP